jgi:hypothetical protein
MASLRASSGLPFLWILLYCVFLGRRCHRVATSESGKLPV